MTLQASAAQTAMRTHYAGEINKTNLGQEVTLCGWVNRRRDLGGLVFIDLRDIKGLVQVFIAPTSPLFATAQSLKAEYCIQVVGKVIARPDSQINNKMATGEIEIEATQLKIFSESPALPIDFNTDVSEEMRLQYRTLDLRRPELQANFILRHKMTMFVRNFLSDRGFLDIETPFLTKATPEGARDYLVPSRVHKGKFYALPQSPQMFKQMLMMSGFDRYYQITKCFRDEDLRSDRQPEFTQIDIETTFTDNEDIYQLGETMIKQLWSQVIGVELKDFPRISYAQAMEIYGSDKPDLRNPLTLQDAKAGLQAIEFAPIAQAIADPKSRVALIKITAQQGSEMSRKQLDSYVDFVKHYQTNLAYIKFNDLTNGIEGIQSSLKKFLTPEILTAFIADQNIAQGDLCFIIADKKAVATQAAGALRIKLGRDLNLTKLDTFEALWVLDFPLYELDDEGQITSAHHPFTSPKEPSLEALKENPLDIVANAYDMVINGYEVLSGSIRNYRADIQTEIFNLLKISPEQQQEKFGFLLEALRYGAPPHGGMAFGLDRLVMIARNTENIKEVVAFPKTNSAYDPLTQAPSLGEAAALDILGIAVKPGIN